MNYVKQTNKADLLKGCWCGVENDYGALSVCALFSGTEALLLALPFTGQLLLLYVFIIFECIKGSQQLNEKTGILS